MPKRDQLRRLVEIDRRIRVGEFPHPDQLATDLEVKRRVIFNDRAYLLNVWVRLWLFTGSDGAGITPSQLTRSLM